MWALTRVKTTAIQRQEALEKPRGPTSSWRPGIRKRKEACDALRVGKKKRSNRIGLDKGKNRPARIKGRRKGGRELR